MRNNEKDDILIHPRIQFEHTCSVLSDDEGTPVFTEPTEFVLNVPKYASGIYDLKNTATIQLTCSQPDYGFTAATRYTVEIALDQAFEKNATLDTKYSTAKMEVDAQEVAVAISNLLGVNEDEFPKAPIPLYVRLTASALTDNKSEIAGSTITSNIIELPQVLPYYAFARSDSAHQSISHRQCVRLGLEQMLFHDSGSFQRRYVLVHAISGSRCRRE